MSPSRSQYYEPSEKLKKHIRFYLDIEIDGDQFRSNPAVNFPTVFPAVNIVFSKDTNDFRVGESIFRGYRLFVGGITRLPGEFVTFNNTRLVTVFFHPTGFQHIFNTSIAPLTNCFTPLETIDPEGATCFLERVMSSISDSKRIECIDDYFLSSLAKSNWKNPGLERAVETILSRNANVKVEELALKLEIPERTLRRHFKQEMGISIKEFIDIARINIASVVITNNPEKRVHELVHMLGYYDQSHLLRHLKKYIGVSFTGIDDLRKTFLSRYSIIEKENPVTG